MWEESPPARRLSLFTPRRQSDLGQFFERPDFHNKVRQEGVDRCYCGCKYWEHDACVSCGGTEVQPDEDDDWAALRFLGGPPLEGTS